MEPNRTAGQGLASSSRIFSLEIEPRSLYISCTGRMSSVLAPPGRASLAQMEKNAVWETWVPKIPWRRSMAGNRVAWSHEQRSLKAREL